MKTMTRASALVLLAAACGASPLGARPEAAPVAADARTPAVRDASPPGALACWNSTCGPGEYCYWPCSGIMVTHPMCVPLPAACGGTFSCACVAGNSGVYKNDAGAYRSCSSRGAPGYGCCDPSGTVWAPQICD